MNQELEIKVTGTQPFMGMEIPVVLGGFGPEARCICDKTAAEIHGMEPKNIRARITDNIKRFVENIDYIDMKIVACQTSNNSNGGCNLLASIGYTKMEISKAEHIYILSERGYFKLVKILNSDQAWDVYENLLSEYFTLREQQGAPNLDALSPQLRVLINLEIKQKEQERTLAAHDQELKTVNQKIDGIRDVVSLSPNSWRPDAKKLITRIAQTMGGNEYIKDVNAEIYQLVDERAGVSLKTRLTNKRRRMADEGVCKSKRDKLNKLDAIADDKKLIEIYIAVVKEMAVKYGVSIDSVPENRTE